MLKDISSCFKTTASVYIHVIKIIIIIGVYIYIHINQLLQLCTAHKSVFGLDKLGYIPIQSHSQVTCIDER